MTTCSVQQAHRPVLDEVPLDILFIILRCLTPTSISRLSRTCRHLYKIIEEYGWNIYAVQNPIPSYSLTPALKYSQWSTRDLVRHQKLARRAWDSRAYVSRPLGPEWSSKLHPIMAINSSRLVIAAGNALFCYIFIPPSRQHFDGPRVIFERVVSFPKDARRDISGVAFDLDGNGLILSFIHGALGRISLPKSPKDRRATIKDPALLYIREGGKPIRSMSTVQNHILTMDSVGTASMYSPSISDKKPSLVSIIDVGDRSPATGWSTHLSLCSSSGYAVLGTASTTPLVVHAITESGLSPYRQAILSPSARASSAPTRDAVYSITGASQTFPSASSSDQIVVAGWYQGIVTLHDLRCPTHGRYFGNDYALSPTVTLHDPLTLSPIYSVSTAGAHIAAGSAQHSLLHLYDIRSPRKGWSIYLPEGRSGSSPVYSCLLESTRLWAATESRAFVVDFGPVHEHTFPLINERNTAPRSRHAASWHAPFFEHSMFKNTYI